MKKSNKLIALLMTAAMVFALCACGGGSSEADSTPVTEEEIPAMYADPDSFSGRTFEFTGQVFNIEKDGDNVYLQVYHDIKNYEDNTVVICPESKEKIRDDDFVKVKGTVDGTFSGENAFGGDISALKVTASKIEVIDAMEAFPAVRTVDVKKSIEKGNYKATVTKVDFTSDETRIYLTVENNGSDTFDHYPDQGIILQNGKQIDAEWNEYYPEPSCSLRAGASYDCVIAFDLIDESDFTYSFDGYDNENYNELEFSFDIKIGQDGE